MTKVVKLLKANEEKRVYRETRQLFAVTNVITVVV